VLPGRKNERAELVVGVEIDTAAAATKLASA